MLKTLDLTATVDYQSQRDPDFGTDAATTFTLGAIPSRIYAQLKDKATRFSQDNENAEGISAAFRPNLIARDIVRFGLKNIKNYPVKFSTKGERVGDKEYQVVSEEVMEVMDIDTIRELSEELKKLCEFDTAEIKNSEG